MSEAGLRIGGRSFGLPDFPWDALKPYREIAASYPSGLIDLSIGSPVDSTPTSAQEALANSSNSPSYPAVIGTEKLRTAMLSFCSSRGITLPSATCVMPTIGSKEAVALLPWQLGIKAGDTVLIPNCAYPTYEVSALLAGATVIPVSEDVSTWPDAELVWINFPGNPHGHVASLSKLKQIVTWARQRGAVVVSDECYAAFSWGEGNPPIPSLLDDQVTEGNLSGLLMLYSLSKESNFAGYRGALVAGDPKLIQDLVQLRKHCGMMVPAPVQSAMAAALEDRASVQVQRQRYWDRRQILLAAIADAGLVNDPDSVAGLYLWVSSADLELDCWQLLEALAKRGILAAPGSFYGSGSTKFVRLALTATDSQIVEAGKRLSLGPLY